ncbi:MAG: hypothetical protein HY716_13045 [Planctomycetes bacterium]|nr:hypothetical protein [Planctomycetota bacterium]
MSDIDSASGSGPRKHGRIPPPLGSEILPSGEEPSVPESLPEPKPASLSESAPPPGDETVEAMSFQELPAEGPERAEEEFRLDEAEMSDQPVGEADLEKFESPSESMSPPEGELDEAPAARDESAAERELLDDLKPAGGRPAIGGGAGKRGEAARRGRLGKDRGVPLRKPSILKKAIFFSIPLLFVVAIAGGFFVKDPDGNNVWRAWLIKMGVVEGPKIPQKKAEPLADATPLDLKYSEAQGNLVRARHFVESLRQIEENPERQTVEKLDEVVQELHAHLEKIDGGMEDINAVVEETNKPEGTILSRVDNVTAMQQQREYLGFRKTLLAQIAKWKHLADQKAGRVAEVPPREVKFDARKAHAWGYSAAGTWARLRVDTDAGGRVTTFYRDHGVREHPEGGVVLAFARSDGSSSEELQTYAGNGVRELPEEALQIGTFSIPCFVVEVSHEGAVTTTWISTSGRGEGWLVLKRERAKDGVASRETATKLGEADFTFKGKDNKLKVVAVEYEVEDAEGRATRTVWYHYDMPGRIVWSTERRESRTVTEEMVGWGTDWAKRPPFPAVDAPVPAAAANPVPRPDPWAERPEGSWIRLRSVFRKAERKDETAFDVMLAKRTAESLTYRQQRWSGGRAEEETARTEAWGAALHRRVIREDTLDIEGRAYPCQVEEVRTERGTERSWMSKEGIPVSLREEVEIEPQGKTVTTVVERISKESLSAAGVEFECLVLDQRTEGGPQGEVRERVWYSPQCPGGVVKRVTTSMADGQEAVMTTELVAMGEDWLRRPPPEAPAEAQARREPDAQDGADADARAAAEEAERRAKAEEEARARADREEKARLSLKDADRLIVEVKPLFVEVRKIAESREWPEGKEAAQELLKKALRAREMLSDARSKYLDGRTLEAEVERIDRVVGTVDKLLEMMDGYIQEIEKIQ